MQRPERPQGTEGPNEPKAIETQVNCLSRGPSRSTSATQRSGGGAPWQAKIRYPVQPVCSSCQGEGWI